MNYKVYYSKNSVLGGIPQLYPENLAKLETLPNTHILVKEVEAESISDVFSLMQAEANPFGRPEESYAYIHGLGLNRTSMCNGDVVEDENGNFHECMVVGWRKLEPIFQKSQPNREELPGTERFAHLPNIATLEAKSSIYKR